MEMFHKTHHIASTEINSLSELKPSSLFTIIQDLSVDGFNYLGYNHKDLFDKDFLWVITRTHVKIIKNPHYEDDIELYTYPNDTKRFIYPRHYFALDKEGNKVIQAVISWVIINAKTRRITTPLDNKVDLKGQTLEDELPLPKSLSHELGELVDTRIVRYSEIDLNKHLNNVKYLDYIADILGEDFFNNNDITDINVDYLKEAKFNDVIKIYMIKENPLRFVGKTDENIIFVMNVGYEKRNS